jgi:hypothetical protein
MATPSPGKRNGPPTWEPVPVPMLPSPLVRWRSTRKSLSCREAPARIELANSGFADRCLTTWLRRRKDSKAIGLPGRSQAGFAEQHYSLGTLKIPRFTRNDSLPFPPSVHFLTCTLAVPLFPSLAAVIVASPSFCAVTTPD